MNKVTIVNNKKTSYHIVHHKDSSECERFACTELQKYLYYSLDCPIPVFSDKCERRGSEILIGNARNNNYNYLIKEKSKEAFIIKEVNDNIIISGNSSRAILYGVYKFLEEFISFKCFTSDCETFEKLNDLCIQKNYCYIHDFSFEYREVYFRCAFDASFASKNMLNSNLADLSSKYGNKIKWFNFHHSFSDMINPNEYFNKHPEYFSLINGKRQKEHTELCLSNQDVFKICLNKVKNWIINNPDCDVFSVAQDEWMGHFIKMACECDECKKIDDDNHSQSGSIITFVNKIAKEIKKEFPNKLIHTFAYQYSRKAPTKVIPLDNVIVRLCNIECSWAKSIKEQALNNPNSEEAKFLNDLTSWSKITNRLYIWDYAVNFRNYLLPFPNLRSMEKNIKLYRENNVKGILMQGNFSYGTGGYLDELKSYVASRMLQDDNRDLNILIKEFCDNYYGAASSQDIIDFINLWEDHVQYFKLWLYDDADHIMFNDDIIKKSYNFLNNAKRKAKSNIYIKRINKLLLSIEYLYLVRLDLNYPNRNQLIDEFKQKLLDNRFTEIFERTALDYSIDVMKNSKYAKERPDWYSLYYIMR